MSMIGISVVLGGSIGGTLALYNFFMVSEKIWGKENIQSLSSNSRTLRGVSSFLVVASVLLAFYSMVRQASIWLKTGFFFLFVALILFVMSFT